MPDVLIVNETTAVSAAWADAWLQWMLDIQIPGILGTGCFYKHQVVKILNPGDPGTLTFAAQFYAESYARYEEWLSQYADSFQRASARKWGQHALSFTTVMTIVQ